MDLRELLLTLPDDTLEAELRSVEAGSQHALLWPIAILPQAAGPSFRAAVLLHRLNPPSAIGCREAVASLAIGWDVSIEEVPWYLVAQFGRAEVVAAAEQARRHADSEAERNRLQTVIYWAKISR